MLEKGCWTPSPVEYRPNLHRQDKTQIKFLDVKWVVTKLQWDKYESKYQINDQSISITTWLDLSKRKWGVDWPLGLLKIYEDEEDEPWNLQKYFYSTYICEYLKQ